jgi:trimethylamine--corrinoid protein Co-methyltransferase
MSRDLIVRRNPQIHLLSDDQIYRIHLASLEILERTGVRFFEPEAVKLLREAGADVTDQTLVRIPSYMIEEALRTVPKRIVISDRNGEPSLFLEGYNAHFGTGTDTQNVIDPFSGKRRQAVEKDVGNAALLCDYLPNIDFVASMGMASDINPARADRHHFSQIVSNTTKPIMFTAWDREGLADIYEMCVLVAGSTEYFRRNPFVIHYAEPTSPLQQSIEATQQLLFCADKGIPLIYVSGPAMGASAPVTMAGALALTNAEWLSSLVVGQLKRKGAPMVYGGGSSPMDMHTTVVPYGGPENWLNKVALRELASHYGVPSFGTGGCSDSKAFDQQAASEATSSLLFNAVAGHSLIHDIGYLESGLTACYEEIVMTDELISGIKKFIKGIEVNGETLAVDAIDRVGPKGNFLIDKHTLKYFKEEIWYPKYFDRQNYDGWFKIGGKSLGEILNEKVKWILKNHQPKPLDPSIKQAIREIVEKEDTNERSTKSGSFSEV